MRLRSAVVVILAASFGALAVSVAPLVAGPSDAVSGGVAFQSLAGAQTPSGVSFDPYSSLAPLVEELMPAVVSITTREKVALSRSMHPLLLPFTQDMPDGESNSDDSDAPFQWRQGAGSGFLISADGYILTNNHVVADADEVEVTLADERSFTAKVIGRDPRTDIALVKVDADVPFPVVALGSSQALRVGDRVVAIGNPFGMSQTVTTGIVSAKGRVIGAGPYDDFIQTDASINPGNSGGPLFDLQGQVIGINTAINRYGQGIAYAVPIDMVKAVVDDLRTDGKVQRGWMGVSLADFDASVARGLGVPESVTSGVLVDAVYADMPAAKAGLRAGDLLVEIDDQAVADSKALVRAVGNRKPGEVMTLGVIRGGKEKELKVTLGERPEEDSIGATSSGDPRQRSGRSGEEAGPAALGLRLQVQGGQVLVAEVDRNGLAAGRLQPGDVVVEINQTPIASTKDANSALSGGGEVALFVIDRQGAQVLVPVPLTSR
jgi:serine protease Do